MSIPLPSELAKVNPATAWQPWEPDRAQPWSAQWASHLYRRMTFGAAPSEIELAVSEGFPATFERLLRGRPETGVRDKMLADLGEEFARDGAIVKLRGWWLYGMLNSGHPFREKLVLFWHNHFATSVNKVHSPTLMYRQNQLQRQYALGSFRPLLGEISRDVAMLIWLDSNKNVKGRPNENYAREVMELFTLGVGNYTEKDVQEAARAFTGWHADTFTERFAFDADEHDDGEKTILGQRGRWNGDDVLRIILDQPAAARFLVRKLYRDFVSETPPPAALLDPLAERFRKSDYDIADLIKTILGSRLFFSEHAYLKRIKSPVEFVLGAAKAAWPGPLAPSTVTPNLETMGQSLFAPPNVKGWPGGKVWLNNATLLARNNFANWVAISIGAGVVTGLSPVPPPPPPPDPNAPAATPNLNAPPPDPVDKFDVSLYARSKKAVTPKEDVAALAEQFFPGGLNAAAAARLQAFIAEGDPKGTNLNRRVRETAHAMMCMPEYQLC